MYIEREALLDELKEHHDYVMQDPEISKTMKWCEAVCYGRTKDIVETLPAADVVEVVRCKDCKECYKGWCELDDVHVKDDHYCSYGERRETDGH